MLDKIDLPSSRLNANLHASYGLRITSLTPLSTGANTRAAKYRVTCEAGTPYFLKLYRGPFDGTGPQVASFLEAQGIEQILPPRRTLAGELWSRCGQWTAVLYPFVEGNNGFDTPLSDQQWAALGAALKAVHRAPLPAPMARRVPEDEYSPRWRRRAAELLDSTHPEQLTDPLALRLTTFLRTRHDELRHLIDRAESLGASLRDEPRPRALCHSDLHAGNVLVHPRGSIFIVDWDAPVLAPKERDLMFIGGGVGGVWNTSRESELFYRGYGAVSIDPVALAFYRFERIVEDVAVFGEQLLSAADGGDADQALQFFLNQFRPNDVVEIARASDVTHGINSRGGQV